MSFLPAESIKVIAEYCGVTSISEDVAKQLAPDVEYRIREIIETGMKFMRHSKRRVLSTTDINNALRLRNVEPLYGFSSDRRMRFRRVGTTDVFFVEDKEEDFNEIQELSLPPCPVDVFPTVHWLAIEGVQPAIPENPIIARPSDLARARPKIGERAQDKEPVALIKVSQYLRISDELEKYFDDVTKIIRGEAGPSGPGALGVLQKEVLNGLATDQGIGPLVAYFTQFIADEVASNLSDLPVLRNLMAMVDSLLSNRNLHVQLYLHQLMPAILTCLVGRSLCHDPLDDHWSLRDFSARLVAKICHLYGNVYSTLQPRVTKTLTHAFLDPHRALTTHYGAVVGLSALGPHVFYLLLLPNIPTYCALLEPELGSANPLKRLEATKCFDVLLRAVGSFFMEYADEYEELAIHERVQALAGAEKEAGALPTAQTEKNGQVSSKGEFDVKSEIFSDLSERYAELSTIFGEKLVPFLRLRHIQTPLL